jgi:hypothetical protein
VRAALWDPTGTGRWIVAGSRAVRDQTDTTTAVSIAALKPNGATDPSFGAIARGMDTPGFVSAELLEGDTGTAISLMREDGTGSWIVIAQLRLDGEESFGVLRFSPTGQLEGAPWQPLAHPAMPTIYPAVAGVPVAGVQTPSGLVVGGYVGTKNPRWKAVRYRPDGAVDATFAAFTTPDFGNGRIVDVTRVGDHLVWLGTRGAENIVVTTALDGSAPVPKVIPPAGIPSPRHLVRHGAAIWIVGTDETTSAAATTVRAALLTVPSLSPVPGWPDVAVSHVVPGLQISAALEDSVGRLVVSGHGVNANKVGAVMLFRFATNSTPDLDFGPMGISDHDDTYGILHAAAVDPSSGNILIAGEHAMHHDGFAVVMRSNTAELPQLRADYGMTAPAQRTSRLKRIIRHQDYDIVVAELVAPIADAVPFAGVAVVVPGQQVRCFGYGYFDHDDDGRRHGLHRGNFTYQRLDGSDLRVGSPDHSLEHGDSGGGCFALDSYRLVGVNRAGYGRRDHPPGFAEDDLAGFLVNIHDVKAWVQLKTGVPMDP